LLRPNAPVILYGPGAFFDMQDRFYIAGQLRQIGRLLSVTGENPFKIRAYERAARALENITGDFDALLKERRLTEIVGIGKALAAAIEEIYHSGGSALLQQLTDELPPGAAELNGVPGLNLKKIVALHEILAIKSVDDLKTACEKGSSRMHGRTSNRCSNIYEAPRKLLAVRLLARCGAAKKQCGGSA
jgi:DNA polymerase (family 10)